MNPNHKNRINARTAAKTAAVVGLAVLLGGCPATAFYEREKLADRAMRFDADDNTTYIRHKAEAAREGGMGGFGGSMAGGCGCQ